MDESGAPAVTAGGVEPVSVSGSSPFATGGGGVVFAHRVAAQYLGCLLTLGRRAEADGLPVTRVSFQNDARHPVDDLLVECSEAGSVVSVAVACRSTPNFVPSHGDTVSLVGSLLAEVAKFEADSHRVAVAVSGWKPQWDELSRLTVIARSHDGLGSFEASIGVDGRWTREVRGRWKCFEKMVAKASGAVSGTSVVRESAWRLLTRLSVLRFDVVSPDERDRAALATSLDAVAVADGVVLRDALEVHAARYDSTGAVVGRGLLRRDVHALVNVAATRTGSVWSALLEHRRAAVSGVGTTVGDASGVGALTVPFEERRVSLAEAMRAVGSAATGLVVGGESGTGKSALVLSTVAELEAAYPGEVESVVVNFRALPSTGLAFRAAVGLSLVEVLSELSAPCRLLVVDAADAALEGSAALFAEMVSAAAEAGVGLVAVSADSAREFVAERVAAGLGKSSEFTMAPLDDSDVAAVADRFPLLGVLLQDLPQGSLFRRLVVLDMLAKTGVEVAGGLSEWDYLQLVWRRVVRGDGQPDVPGSPQARENALLALAAAELKVPSEHGARAGLSPEAEDALRGSHLLLPRSVYQPEPKFVHDEVRRYATAILLVRDTDPVALLEAGGVQRWAVSAAALACKGRLLAAGAAPAGVFLGLVSAFGDVAASHGPRWADVPVEAVFETPHAYDCLKAALAGSSPVLALADVVRVATQRHGRGGNVSVDAVAPVVQLLLDEETPWDVSDESFDLLAGWLQALVIARVPAGNELRVRLRQRLLDYWNSFPLPAPEDERVFPWGMTPPPRRRRLDYHLTGERFVEVLALLGPDIDDDAETCLRALAERAPAFLAPAADSMLGARAVATRDPDLLALLMEAYYINKDGRMRRMTDAIRHHQGRWRGWGPPNSAYYYGGFLQLFQTAHPATAIRVLNNVLNHGAAECERRIAARDRMNPFTEPGGGAGESAAGVEERGLLLNLDGSPRRYDGDGNVWGWYRGSVGGPDSAASALLAAEHVAEGWLKDGALPSRVVDVFLEGCTNLAVPGMLFGLLVRQAEKTTDELDRFLAEPAVWELEFSRSTYEHIGYGARTEGLVNLERRKWTPREVCAWLLMSAGGVERAAELKAVGEQLIANGERLGVPQERTRAWAVHLDSERYEFVKHDGQVYIQATLPADLEAIRLEQVASQALSDTSMRLQNRYRSPITFDPARVLPTTAEIAADLTVARELLEEATGAKSVRPLEAAALVARTAVEHAVSGDVDALGTESEFVTALIVDGALSYRDVNDKSEEEQYDDVGADRTAAYALPAFLTTNLRGLLEPVGRTVNDVIQGGMALARRGSRESRLHLARGCDVVWSAPCYGTPCIHQTAFDWLLETARAAEIGPWDQDLQGLTRVWIEGDVIGRLAELDGKSVDLDLLVALLRGLGVAASTDHCLRMEAQSALATLLDVQRRALVLHQEEGWSTDHQGSQALTAGRALLQGVAAGGDAQPVLTYLDVVRADDGLLADFLHYLAAAGAQSDALAGAARRVWPQVVEHALTFANDGGHDPYRGYRRDGWASAALLPEPLTWVTGLYAEVSGPPIDWVEAETLTGLIDSWVPTGSGRTRCADALIALLRRLPAATQATDGIRWLTNVCVQDGKATVRQSFSSNSWLREIRQSADELGTLADWQRLVDMMVVAGNDDLAPYSR